MNDLHVGRYCMCMSLQPDYYRDAPHFRRVGDGPQYRLEIPRAKLDFTGAYSVIARNCHGEAKAVISLQIYAKGKYASYLQGQFVKLFELLITWSLNNCSPHLYTAQPYCDIYAAATCTVTKVIVTGPCF